MPTSQQIHVDAPLTNLSVAYIQDQNNYIADKVFPVVPVKKQSDRYFVYKKEDWFRDEAKERAPGTESAGGDYEIDNTPTYFCTKYSYHKDVTEDDRQNADDPLRPDQDAEEFVTDKMLLRRENLWAGKYFVPGVWATDVQGVASTTPEALQFTQWDKAESDPMLLISLYKTNIRELTGKNPNRLVLGARVYEALCNHPKVLDRIKYTERGVVTVDLLAALFDVEKVIVANAIQNVAAKGKAAQMRFIFGKNVLLTYAAPNPGIKQPSGGYIFSWTGLLGAGAFGNRISRIPAPLLGQGTERIEGDIAFDAKMVGPDLGVFFKDAVA
jgi:hypothetical protein